MKRRALLCLATVAALVAFVALPGAANAQSTTAGPNAVTHWNEIAASTLVAMPGPAGGAPSALQINMGMTQGAVYDAINAITPKHHRPYLLNRRFSARASGEAAAATAAYRVLSNIISTVPAGITFPNRDILLQSLADQYDTSLNAIPDSPFKTQGIAAGNAAADAMIAARAGDGRFGPSQWGPNSGSGALAAAVAERDVARSTRLRGSAACGRFCWRAPHSSAPPAPRPDERRLHGGLQRGQGARRRRRGDHLDPHARPDVQRDVLAERGGSGLVVERRRAQLGRGSGHALDLADTRVSLRC